MAAFTTQRNKSQWHWTVMILVPDWLSTAHVEQARARVSAKGGAPSLANVRVQTLEEGLCVQTLHLGRYDDEAPVLARMHKEHIAEQGLHLCGHHQEIYLSDPRRVTPTKLRTILRQPVRVRGP